jgi:ABC-type spermidine/putrescine transport system permease subunit II
MTHGDSVPRLSRRVVILLAGVLGTVALPSAHMVVFRGVELFDAMALSSMALVAMAPAVSLLVLFHSKRWQYWIARTLYAIYMLCLLAFGLVALGAELHGPLAGWVSVPAVLGVGLPMLVAVEIVR